MTNIKVEFLTHAQIVARTQSEPENVDLFVENVINGRKELRLQFMHNRYARNERYIVAYLGKRIVAAAGIATDFCDKRTLCLNHVSVEPQHRRKGLASMVIEAMYVHAIENGQQVCVTAFVDLGHHLVPTYIEFDRKYPQAASGLRAAL